MTQFEQLVKAMRDAQRKYFRTRSYDDLTAARELERQVDSYLRNAETPELPL